MANFPGHRVHSLPVGLFDKILTLASYSPSTGWANAAAISSPWSVGSGLDPAIFPEVGALQVTKSMALTVPPVARAIALYSTAVAKLELAADTGPTPRWMNNTFDSITPGKRLADIVQDLIFHGESCLIVDRDAGGIRDALHMPFDLWATDQQGRITFNGEPAEDQAQFIHFQGLMPEGFLTYAADSVREYRSIRRTINDRADNPIPMIELDVQESFEGTDEELEDAQKKWNKARRAPGGATAITPLGVKANPISGATSDEALLIGARNAVRLDMANFLNINAAMLDGNNGTSDTYSNTLQNKNEFESLSLSTWTTPIEQRLSQPDVMPSGVKVRFPRFDTPTESKGNTGTAVQPAPTTQEANA